MSRASHDTRSGFTLLEVLAAVAILGIWYVMLATWGIDGLRKQGESQRRLQASLLADETLAELEAQLEMGSLPKPGDLSFEEGLFEAEWTVEPMPIAGLLTAAGFELATGLDAGLISTAGASPLVQIELEVRWSEPFGERRVVRTTYGLNHEVMQPILVGAGVVASESEDSG